MSGISFVVQKPHPCLLWHDVFSTLLGDFLAKSFHLTFILLPLFLPPPVPQKEVDLLIPDFKSVHSLEIFLGLWFKCPPSRCLFQKRWPKGKRNTQIEQKWPKVNLSLLKKGGKEMIKSDRWSIPPSGSLQSNNICAHIKKKSCWSHPHAMASTKKQSGTIFPWSNQQTLLFHLKLTRSDTVEDSLHNFVLL